MKSYEKCLKCSEPGNYWEFNDGILISLCERHARVEASS